MVTLYELEHTAELLCGIRDKLSEELNELPEGNLFFKREHGVYRAYMRVHGKEKYLGAKHAALVEKLIRRKELEKALSCIGENIYILDKASASYTDLNSLLPSSTPLLIAGVSGISENNGLTRKEVSALINDWASNHYNNIDYFAESKDQTTSDGHRVRSKSELAIYEYLLSHDIPFRYEEPLDLGNMTKIPDFTLLRQDGKKFIWEHFGMLKDEVYYRNAINKLYSYMDYGFLPYDNIIISYDYEDGSINMEYIDRVLRALGFID